MQVTKNVRKIMRASFGTTANRTGIPNVCQALSSKLIAQTQAPLGTKFIFVASNFLAYHHIGINNYGYLIGAFQNAGAPVTSTVNGKISAPLGAPYNKRPSRASIFRFIFVGNFLILFFFAFFFKISISGTVYFSTTTYCSTPLIFRAPLIFQMKNVTESS